MKFGSLRLTGPTVDAEPRERMKRSTRRVLRKQGGLRRWVRRLALLLVLLALLPLGLTFLYRLPGVQPISTLMLVDAVTLKGYNRQWVPIEEMGPAIVNSVMMSEDGQFCSHEGVDWKAFNLVLEEAFAGEKARGASTIPMQTAKNLFLWNGRSYIRKGIELPLALYIDWVLPKRRIMEIYLNIAEWGPNIYGAEAAAQYHFGRSARDLSARQAALLAVTLPNPAVRDPGNPSAGLSRLAAMIERRARQAGAYVGCLR